jgi:hypothetical protein
MSAPLTVDGVPRTETPNPFGYTDDQLQEKKLAIKTMRELYPNVPVMYCDWVYDLCKNTPPDEMEEMKKRIDTNPSKYAADVSSKK